MRTTPCVLLAEEVWGSGLQAIRSLGRLGVPVYVATAGAGASIYGRSRYCTGAADFDPSESAMFCASVLRWLDSQGVGNQLASGTPGDRHPGDKHGIPVIPLSDRLVDLLHQSRGLFDESFRLSIPAPDVTEVLLDKTASLRVAERAGLDVPRWVELRSPDDLAKTDDLRLPVAIRPTSWSTAGNEYFKIAVGRDRGDVQNQAMTALEQGATLIAQEYIEANDDDVELAITWNNKANTHSAICTGRKRRQASADGGVMVWGVAEDLPAVRRFATSFLTESGFSGLGGLEFIRAGGKSWFIEFNPRLEAIHFLAARAGVDTVVMEYDELAFGLSPVSQATQHPATAWIGSAWLTRLMGDPSGWRTAVADRVAFARSPRRIRAVWSARDPLPGIAVGSRLASRAARSLMRKRGTHT